MSTIVNISSPQQYAQLIQSSTVVVTDFWAEWCGPCKMIAPVYEELARSLSRPGKVTFAKVDTDAQKKIAETYQITAMPTFTVIKSGREVQRVRGANPQKLQQLVTQIAAEAESAGGASSSAGGSGGAFWHGAAVSSAYADITAEVDIKGIDLMNHDSDFGNARTPFDAGKPSALDAKGKGDAAKDWVESDTDDQLMLFVPFQSVLKIHTIHLTSLPPADDDEVMRPKTIHLYVNSAHNLGFEEAGDIEPTQKIELGEADWDAKTGTAKVELRFVRFQKCSSLVVFVVDGAGNGEKVRLDRIRLVGDAGEKKTMGKLEKIGDEQGE